MKLIDINQDRQTRRITKSELIVRKQYNQPSGTHIQHPLPRKKTPKTLKIQVTVHSSCTLRNTLNSHDSDVMFIRQTTKIMWEYKTKKDQNAELTRPKIKPKLINCHNRPGHFNKIIFLYWMTSKLAQQLPCYKLGYNPLKCFTTYTMHRI